MNIKPAVKPIYVSYALETNNIFVSGLELLVILYQVNQPADLQLWNNNFCFIFLFEVDEYLASNTKSIICSLLRMAAFIKQCSLKNRIAKNIPQISKFSFVVQEFLSAIYKSRWNKLTANNKDMSFRQYMSSQFNKTSTKNTITYKLTKGKQANILRISLPIPLRPSKSILAKFKFFKKNQSLNLVSNFNYQSYV